MAQFAEALRYELEGRQFDSQYGHWLNPSSRSMALGSTRPLTDTNIRNISRVVKAAVAYSRHPYHLHVPQSRNYGNLNLLQHKKPVQACTELVFC